MSGEKMHFNPTVRSMSRGSAAAVASPWSDAPSEGPFNRPRLLGVSCGATGRTGRSQSRAARANIEARARRLLEHKLEYVYHSGFDEPSATARYLAPTSSSASQARGRGGLRSGQHFPSAGVSGNATLLKPEEETQLFLKMNYLKYRASKLREALDPSRATASAVAAIERLETEAFAVKNHIVRSNMRLVASIAKNRASRDRSYMELVSDGAVSLILAAEKFDVARGFKFSTYAYCSITRALTVTTVKEIGWRRQFATGRSELFEACVVGFEWGGVEDGPRSGQKVVERMLGGLSDRERAVIAGRFGLDDGREKTLRELGEQMGITKERVRQLELRARNKLRAFALEDGLDPTAA
jgi:RNA polymerase primary sigma factor